MPSRWSALQRRRLPCVEIQRGSGRHPKLLTRTPFVILCLFVPCGPGFRRAAVSHLKSMVSLMGASSNRLEEWLRRLSLLRTTESGFPVLGAIGRQGAVTDRMPGELLRAVYGSGRKVERFQDAAQRTLARPAMAALILTETDGRHAGCFGELNAAQPAGHPQDGERLAERDRTVPVSVGSHVRVSLLCRSRYSRSSSSSVLSADRCKLSIAGRRSRRGGVRSLAPAPGRPVAAARRPGGGCPRPRPRRPRRRRRRYGGRAPPPPPG